MWYNSKGKENGIEFARKGGNLAMGIDRDEIKKAVDMLPEEKLAVLQWYVKMLQKSGVLKNGDADADNQEDPVLNVLGCLSGEPLTARKIEEELYGRDAPRA